MRGAGPLALLLLCLATPVVADPRTDVLSTAARCNAIADYRVWLDCYYGAAQSMRALLGLAPAPPAQTRLVPPARAARRLRLSHRPPVPPRSRRKPMRTIGPASGWRHTVLTPIISSP